MDLADCIARQIVWSRATFGPGKRTGGLLDHLRKELKEVERAPDDLAEWADLIILALDGAWRHGSSPAEVCAALEHKQAVNFARQWPDWRASSEDVAIEHVRSVE